MHYCVSQKFVSPITYVGETVSINKNIMDHDLADGVSVIYFSAVDLINPNTYPISNVLSNMGLFDNELKPGHGSLRPCPNCNEDRIYRTSSSIFSLTMQYYCDECGYEATKQEVQKSGREIMGEGWDEAKRDLAEANSEAGKKSKEDVDQDEKVSVQSEGKIENAELKKQVENRKLEGWEIEEIDNQNERVVMTSTKGGSIGGHALTGLTTGLWTFGAGNVIYNKLSKKKNSEKIVLTAQQNGANNKEVIHKEDFPDKIQTLSQLHDDGILTEDEFERKKEDLLEKY